MKSLQKQGAGVVTCVDLPDPQPGPGEVVIATHISAICGSEMKTYRGTGKADGNSGHEAVGVVTQLGTGVTILQVGQRVGNCHSAPAINSGC